MQKKASYTYTFIRVSLITNHTYMQVPLYIYCVQVPLILPALLLVFFWGCVALPWTDQKITFEHPGRMVSRDYHCQ